MLNQSNHKEKFENFWQTAFDEAELTPHEHVWEKIDTKLDKLETQQLKKSIIYYRWMVAASISMLMMVGAYATFNFLENAWYAGKTDSSGESFQKPESPEHAIMGTEEYKNSSEAGSEGNVASVLSEASEKEPKKEIVAKSTSEQKKAHYMTTENNEPHENYRQHLNLVSQFAAFAKRKFEMFRDNEKLDFFSMDGLLGFNSFLNEQGSRADVFGGSLVPGGSQFTEGNDASPGFVEGTPPLKDKNQNTQPDPLKVNLGFIEDEIIKEEKKSPSRKYFAGLALGTDVHGGAPIPIATTMGLSSDRQMVAADGMTSAFSQPAPIRRPVVNYSYGINGGISLNEKWQIQAGLQYAHYSLSSRSHLTINETSGKSYAYYQPVMQFAESSGRYGISNSAVYTINSTFNYLSVPLKAGYTIGKKKLSMNFSAGLLTDLFLNNVIADDNNQFDRMVVSGGSDQPFQNVYLSGLVSTDLNYKVFDHYTVSLSPFFRQGINLTGEPDYFVENRPHSFGVNFGLRYHF